jgi:hypothetical protein
MAAKDPERTPQPAEGTEAQPAEGPEAQPAERIEALAAERLEALGDTSAGSPGEAVPLLVKAIASLPDGERDQVYVWLLSRPRLHQVSSQLMSLQSAGGSPGSQQMAQQMVPVRFSADQHSQLRAWCAEHGFSMATVIRGLVARFLESQRSPDS